MQHLSREEVSAKSGSAFAFTRGQSLGRHDPASCNTSTTEADDSPAATATAAGPSRTHSPHTNHDDTPPPQLSLESRNYQNGNAFDSASSAETSLDARTASEVDSDRRSQNDGDGRIKRWRDRTLSKLTPDFLKHMVGRENSKDCRRTVTFEPVTPAQTSGPVAVESHRRHSTSGTSGGTLTSSAGGADRPQPFPIFRPSISSDMGISDRETDQREASEQLNRRSASESPIARGRSSFAYLAPSTSGSDAYRPGDELKGLIHVQRNSEKGLAVEVKAYIRATMTHENFIFTGRAGLETTTRTQVFWKSDKELYTRQQAFNGAFLPSSHPEGRSQDAATLVIPFSFSLPLKLPATYTDVLCDTRRNVPKRAKCLVNLPPSMEFFSVGKVGPTAGVLASIQGFLSASDPSLVAKVKYDITFVVRRQKKSFDFVHVSKVESFSLDFHVEPPPPSSATFAIPSVHDIEPADGRDPTIQADSPGPEQLSNVRTSSSNSRHDAPSTMAARDGEVQPSDQGGTGESFLSNSNLGDRGIAPKLELNLVRTIRIKTRTTDMIIDGENPDDLGVVGKHPARAERIQVMSFSRRREADLPPTYENGRAESHEAYSGLFRVKRMEPAPNEGMNLARVPSRFTRNQVKVIPSFSFRGLMVQYHLHARLVVCLPRGPSTCDYDLESIFIETPAVTVAADRISSASVASRGFGRRSGGLTVLRQTQPRRHSTVAYDTTSELQTRLNLGLSLATYESRRSIDAAELARDPRASRFIDPPLSARPRQAGTIIERRPDCTSACCHTPPSALLDSSQRLERTRSLPVAAMPSSHPSWSPSSNSDVCGRASPSSSVSPDSASASGIDLTLSSSQQSLPTTVPSSVDHEAASPPYPTSSTTGIRGCELESEAFCRGCERPRSPSAYSSQVRPSAILEAIAERGPENVSSISDEDLDEARSLGLLHPSIQSPVSAPESRCEPSAVALSGGEGTETVTLSAQGRLTPEELEEQEMIERYSLEDLEGDESELEATCSTLDRRRAAAARDRRQYSETEARLPSYRDSLGYVGTHA
ncbi:hypothetical protein IE53DRAFT_371600 [Violaceomyces palustris]|uniref:Uncharacterized protein n=1 Tax=Violaceomyces palustris TaxID=1673888 RepID=A0ACD0NN77_9BASI|nr:hypothetical protein IE53DRAFT_371600 [Violaceomyces palustris]